MSAASPIPDHKALERFHPPMLLRQRPYLWAHPPTPSIPPRWSMERRCGASSQSARHTSCAPTRKARAARPALRLLPNGACPNRALAPADRRSKAALPLSPPKCQGARPWPPRRIACNGLDLPQRPARKLSDSHAPAKSQNGCAPPLDIDNHKPPVQHVQSAPLDKHQRGPALQRDWRGAGRPHPTTVSLAGSASTHQPKATARPNPKPRRATKAKGSLNPQSAGQESEDTRTRVGFLRRPFWRGKLTNRIIIHESASHWQSAMRKPPAAEPIIPPPAWPRSHAGFALLPLGQRRRRSITKINAGAILLLLRQAADAGAGSLCIWRAARRSGRFPPQPALGQTFHFRRANSA